MRGGSEGKNAIEPAHFDLWRFTKIDNNSCGLLMIFKLHASQRERVYRNIQSVFLPQKPVTRYLKWIRMAKTFFSA